MSSPLTYRRPPRGRPLIGFQLEVPGEVELVEGDALICREVGVQGQTLGELEIRVFPAALVIDRDGILAQTACEALSREAVVRGGATAVAMRLPGASGYRADAVHKAPLPYRHVFAVADDGTVDGGVLVTIRCAKPDWSPGDHMLGTLRIVTRSGRLATSTEDADGPMLPMVVQRRD